MVEKISVQIALEGGKEVEKQLADIGEAGKKAFADLAKSAEDAGGFKNIKPDEVTAKLQQFGVTGADAINKIQTAVKSAGRLEQVAGGVAALETGFLAVGAAAGVAGVAVAAAAAGLGHYTSEAAKVAEALTPLAAVSGEAFQKLSALQIAFAQGGTSAEKFASSFTNLELKVQEAARTMAVDVEASSQRIAQAHQNAEQASLSVAGAELSLRQARLAARKQVFGEKDPDAEKRIADSRAELAVREAQQRVAAAQLAQQQAEHAVRVAEANDLQKNIDLYKQMAAGQKATFDALTTGATKNAALFATLAQAGNNWKFVLADILKNASELERIQIGRQLGLDPKQIDTLKGGSAELKAQQAAVERLGIALTDVDQTNLKAFSDSWSMLGATVSAALQKLGAAIAPVGTLLAQGLQIGLELVINIVATTKQEFLALWSVINAGVTASAQVIAVLVDAVTAVGTAIASITWDNIISVGVAAWNALTAAIGGAIDKLLIYLGLQGEAGGTPLPGGAPIGGPGGGIGSNAAGGLLGGRGTGTSDSNLAWVSRGEFIMPARAVQQPGVLAFLEALRRSGGMRGYNRGGLIPAYAGGGLVVEVVPDLIKALDQVMGKIKDSLIQLARNMAEMYDKVADVQNKLIDLLAKSLTEGGFAGGFASGGLLGGRGTGTSDSNLVRVSRGEHIMPAAAVQQPGVLAFLEALRRSGGNLSRVLDGMGRFALGGMVPKPAMAFANGGPVGGMSNVTIAFPGLPEIGGLRASSVVVDELRKAAALAQVRSGGRKPSRYS